MRQSCQVQLFCFLCCISLIKSLLFSSELALAPEEQKKIAEKVWYNECGGKKEGLCYWKEGENWASLGIGHFIWYPASFQGPFEETFPSLLRFMKKEGAVIPPWLESFPPCPWKTKNEFDKNRESAKMKELCSFLDETQVFQMCFMLKRVQEALSLMEGTLKEETKEKVSFLLNRLLQDKRGVFALIDYVNFKGTGLTPSERYQGKGWGLLQVLCQMKKECDDPLVEFVRAAKTALIERVEHAPPERRERRWLTGWCNRVERYIEED